jgi:hypothetical protein
VALATRNAQLVRENPTFTKKKFLYNLSHAEYERNWGNSYQRPGFGARVLALIFRLIPKVGPFKAIGFKVPNPDTENLYMKSVNATVEQYRVYLQELETRSLSSQNFSLQNRDFDTGKPTKAGEYELTDHAYAKLLDKLAERQFANLAPALRENILQFYADANAQAKSKMKSNADEWQKALKNVEQLKAVTMVPAKAQNTRAALAVAAFQ